MANILFLGSKSSSRQSLLRAMGINFLLVEQNADESIDDSSLSFKELLTAVALQKMDHVIMPKGRKGETAFVLTADTMGQDAHGQVHGKPMDKQDAVAKIKALRGKGLVATVFCLDRKVFDGTKWQVDQRILEYVEAQYEFNMPDSWIEPYLERTPNYLQVSGAITIEGYGAQFLKSIKGSYSTVLGLPVFELRQALERIKFF